MNRLPLPDADYLRSILNYDPETGVFTWRRRANAYRGVNKRCSGVVAGTTRSDGYVRICIDYQLFWAHRLAWCWMMGNSSTFDIDHIDGNKSNNRFFNLRLATRMQNAGNTFRRIDNISGCKGVCWHKRSKKWVAQIGINRKSKFLGYFSNIEVAAEAYKRAAIHHFGEFARLT